MKLLSDVMFLVVVPNLKAFAQSIHLILRPHKDTFISASTSLFHYFNRFSCLSTFMLFLEDVRHILT